METDSRKRKRSESFDSLESLKESSDPLESLDLSEIESESPEYYLQLEAKFGAELERYERLSPEEKIAENGLRLQEELESDRKQYFLLQPSPPRHMSRAQCRARYCLFPERVIREEYRIAWVTHERGYFHVLCLEKMIDLPSLAPERFKLDNGIYRWKDNFPWPWGLMQRKWFEHSGYIDIKVIARYIKAYERYRESDSEWSTKCTAWQFRHKESCVSDPCECSFPLEPPAEPTLEGYITESQKCLLSRVLRHRYAEELAPSILLL